MIKVKKGDSVLINHPSIGSLWLSNVEITGQFVSGEVWDDSDVGSPYLPDDFRGEKIAMSFPISCIRKVEREEIK